METSGWRGLPRAGAPDPGAGRVLPALRRRLCIIPSRSGLRCSSNAWCLTECVRGSGPSARRSGFCGGRGAAGARLPLGNWVLGSNVYEGLGDEAALVGLYQGVAGDDGGGVLHLHVHIHPAHPERSHTPPAVTWPGWDLVMGERTGWRCQSSRRQPRRPAQHDGAGTRSAGMLYAGSPGGA